METCYTEGSKSRHNSIPQIPVGQSAHQNRIRRRGLVEYGFDEPIVRQVFVVLSYDGFCFPQCSESPLNLQIFISSDAFYNSTFFYQQLEFSWLIDVFGVACNFRNWGCEIDAPGGDPIPFYETLVRYMSMTPERWKSGWTKVENTERGGD